MKKLGIVLPLYISNQQLADYLPYLTKSIRSNIPFYFIYVENFIDPSLKVEMPFEQQPIEIIKLIPEGQQGVAKGWNTGIKKATELGCDYIAVLNLDTVMKHDTLDLMMQFFDNRDEKHVLVSPQEVDCDPNEAPLRGHETDFPHFSCFMVRGDFLQTMGTFDENFWPYGYDDCDMDVRIKQSGKIGTRIYWAVFYHAGSQTTKKDEKYLNDLHPRFIKNREYFIKKWGFQPPRNTWEYYRTPFNKGGDINHWEFINV